MCFYVFRRRADGTFGPRERINLDYPADKFSRWDEFHLNGLKSRIAVADWNGDGKPDVLVGGYGGPRMVSSIAGDPAGRSPSRAWAQRGRALSTT